MRVTSLRLLVTALFLLCGAFASLSRGTSRASLKESILKRKAAKAKEDAEKEKKDVRDVAVEKPSAPVATQAAKAIKTESCLSSQNFIGCSGSAPSHSVVPRQLLALRGGSASKVKHVPDADYFNQALKDAGDKLVVVDFSATWCGPCKMIAPVYDDLSNEYSSAVFLKVDVDEVPEITAQYQVMAMPTFLFLRKSQLVERFSGASVDKLRSVIEQLL